VRVKIGRLAQW